MKQSKITIERDGKVEKVIDCEQYILVSEVKLEVGKIFQSDSGFSAKPIDMMSFYLAMLDLLNRLEADNEQLGIVRKDYQEGVFDEIIKRCHHISESVEEEDGD